MGKLWPILVVSIFDIALAYVLASFTSTDKVFIFTMTLGVLWVLPLVVGLWSLAKFWVAYPLFLKRRLVRIYKADMHQNEFPAARGFFDHMAYLSHILDEEEFEQKAKSKAAFFVGAMATYRSERPFTMGLAVQHAFEQAMDEYVPVSTRQEAGLVNRNILGY